MPPAPSRVSGAHPAPPEETTRWSLVAAVCAAGIAVSFQVGKVPPALALLAEDFGVSTVMAGWLISIFTLMAAAVGVAVGGITDSLGARRALLIGMGISAAGAVAGALAPTPAILLATRPIEGAGFLLCVASGPALITRATRTVDRRFAFGFWGAYFPLGVATMVALGPVFLATFGWRGLWLANAGALILAALIVGYATRSLDPAAGPKPTDRRLGPTLMAALRRPGSWLIGVCFACYSSQFLSVMGFLPWWLERSVGLDRSVAAYATAFAVLVNVPGNIVGGWLLARGWGRDRLIVGAAVCMAFCHLAIQAPGLPDETRYAAVLLLSLVGGLIPAVLFAAVPVHAGAAVALGAANGLLVQGTNIGQLIGPPAVAAVVTAAGSWTAAPWVFIPLAVGCAVVGAILGHLERRIPKNVAQ